MLIIEFIIVYDFQNFFHLYQIISSLSANDVLAEYQDSEVEAN